MVQDCVAYGCKERSSRGTSVSFHGFPRDEELRKKWEVSLRRGNFQASKHSRVCSKHFTPECFDMEAFGKGRKLKKGSVPSIFDFSEHLQTQVKKTKAPKKRGVAFSDFCDQYISMSDETKNASMICGGSCEMHTKIEIKEEDPLQGITSKDERDFLPKHFAVEVKSEAVHLDDCDLAIKTEFKSEASSPEYCSQEDNKFSAVKIEQYSRCQTENKEDCWLETSITGTSSVFDEIRDGDFPPVKSPRLSEEAVSDDSRSPLSSVENSRKDTSFYNEMHHPECESEESDVIKTLAAEKQVHSEKFGEGKINSKVLIHKDKRPHKCDICDKRFINMSHLKRHEFIHRSERPHKCDICQRCFSDVSHLKAHIFIHMEIKPHKCKLCDKGFIRLSSLKLHNWIHEGKKPHKCEICERNFTRLSNLKMHKLIHEGKKPHKCEICEKSFTQLTHLKMHSLIHQGKKPHTCEICQKRFTLVSHLKQHSVIHTCHKAKQV